MDIRNEQEAYKNAQEQRAARRSKIEDLVVKVGNLTNELERLKSETSASADYKSRAHLDFAAGKASREDVENANLSHSAAMDAEAKTAELLSTVTTALEREQSYGDMTRQTEAALWNKVCSEIKTDIAASVVDRVREFHAARTMSGRGITWANLMIELFGNDVRDREFKVLCDKMKNKYLS